MKKTMLALSILALAAGGAAARGGSGGGRSGGRSGGHSGGRSAGFAGQGHFSRPLSRPSIPRASSSASGSTSRTGFVGHSSTARSSFGNARMLTGAGTGTPGGGTSGGTAGGTGSGGSAGGTSSPAVVYEQGGWATPGSKILSNGQQPVYSQASGGGQFSVDGGGFVAINQAQAGDVGRAPGVTWSQPDKLPSSGSGGISGSGASANGPNPGF